jgi:hypothetical protein
MTWFIVSLYLVGAVVAGWLYRWLDTSRCPCCGGPPANHGWWVVLLAATLWPASLLSALWAVVTSRSKS